MADSHNPTVIKFRYSPTSLKDFALCFLSGLAQTMLFYGAPASAALLLFGNFGTSLIWICVAFVFIWLRIVRRLELDEYGIRLIGLPGVKPQLVPWSQVTSVTQVGTRKTLLRACVWPYCGPKRAANSVSATGYFRLSWKGGSFFFPPKDKSKFIQDFEHALAQARNASIGPPMRSVPPDALNDSAPSATLHSTGAALLQGARAAFFRPLAPSKIVPSVGQLLALIAVGTALQFAHDFVQIGPKGEIALFGLPSLLYPVSIALLGSWLLTTILRRPSAVLGMVVLACAITIAVAFYSECLFWLLDHSNLRRLLRGSQWAYLFRQSLMPVWVALAISIAGFRVFRPDLRRAALAGVPVFLAFWAPLQFVEGSNTLWMQPFDQEEYQQRLAAYNVALGEGVLYSQPKILDAALAAIGPSQPDRISLYFVGVAGDGSQDVFMKEVNYVANQFATRFGSAGRTVTLVNNPKTLRELPIASVTGLSAALMRIGEVMDKEKDILFLYMTSHGSHDHQFSLRLGSMQFDRLDPAALKKMLDASGIKRRVVVVSACYSGGFVEPLKSPDSVIITAASKDRQSHGCSNEADFTYFGKAYFEQGLQKTDSFIEAFKFAAPLIAEREAADDFEPAQPQVFVGERMAEVLENFAKQQAIRRPPLAH